MILLTVASFATISAQSKYATIEGIVNDVEAGTPLSYATVVLSPSGQYAMTDEKGRYSFAKVTPGVITIKVEFYGKISQAKELNASGGGTYAVNFNMEDMTFRMEEVVVTAQRSQAGASTSSVISRQAMDHLSTSSLSDVMTLLPGVAAQNPSLSKAQALTLRAGADGSNAALAMNSLGTAIIVDGAPISNNSNLQTLAPAMSGYSEAIMGGSPASGVDTRSLSTDNIESVEVIRGIPSAQYGDLTSGAILVKSKAGSSPLTVRFKTNPQIYQASAAKGFHAGRAGDFNISADYAYNNKSLVSAYKSYERINGKLLWSKSAGILSNNASLDVNYSREKQDRNPDMESLLQKEGSRSIGLRITDGGHINFSDAGWLKSIDYNFSGSYTDKHSFSEETVSNALNLYTTSMTSGSVISNVAGKRVYDASGREITNYLGDDAAAKASYMPYSYFSHYDVYGKELNAYAKVMANFYAKLGERADNRIAAGADFKSDGNLGEGLVFPEGTPPRRDVSNMQSGFRTRHYYDIPFVNQLGLFFQDDFSLKMGKRALNLSAGLRYDNINGMQALAPRLNASLDIFPRVLTLRGGWGITSKAPTVMYMYPFNAYCDLTLYNNSGTSARINGQTVNVTPEETLIVAKTIVYDTSNPDLEIARNRKAEVGFDLTIADRYTLAVTAYDELMRNGYTMGQDFSCFNWMRVAPYVALSGGVGTGEQPTLTEGEPVNLFFEYYKPMNTAQLHSRGIEFELDLGRFEQIRTSFYLNGAYTQTRSSSSGYSFSQNQNTATTDITYDNHIAVWEPGRRTLCYDEALTTLRATHNIPDIGFVVTLMVQVDWMQRSWTKYYHEDVWTKYISWKDGQVYDFDPALKDDPEYSYMKLEVSDSARIVERTQPYALVNLNLSKEIGNLMTATFYVNNLFNYRPVYEKKASTGTYEELGIPMFFGFDLKLTIR